LYSRLMKVSRLLTFSLSVCVSKRSRSSSVR
jgi:hypothetical protein